MSSGCSPTGSVSVRPPTRSRASSTLTSSPAALSSRAAVSPASPAPTIATSQSCIARSIHPGSSSRQIHLAVDHGNHAASHPWTARRPSRPRARSGAPSPHPAGSRSARIPLALARYAPSGPAADPVAGSSPISTVRVKARARAVPLGLAPGQVEDEGIVGLDQLVDRRVVGQGPGQRLGIRDRRHQVRQPGGDDLRGQLGVCVGARNPTAVITASGSSSAPNSGSFCTMSARQRAVLGADLDRLEPGRRLLDEARLVEAAPARHGNTGPERGMPGEGDLLGAGPRSGFGSRHPRYRSTARRSSRRASSPWRRRASSPRRSRPRRPTTASPLPASGRSAKTSRNETGWSIRT